MAAQIDISVVVVSYQITRELPRTLLSLARPYQTAARSLRYEVIVVDNGSDPRPQMGDFAGLDLDLRILRCGTYSASPVFALNEGLAMARGALIGAWIDGARLASPGLLSAVQQAAQGLECPVLAPLNWQIGPQRQHESAAKGYDQTVEDRLLADIGWPETPYALFGASTCETVPHPTGPLLESNALFLRRESWDALGGYDTAFDEAGGGAANPDMLLRAHGLPGAQLVRIIDEGTFHQFHGGLTTAETRAAAAQFQLASRKYFTLRGKPIRQIREPGIIYRHQARNLEEYDHASLG